MAKNSKSGWAALSGDPEKDREQYEPKKPTWSTLSGDPDQDRETFKAYDSVQLRKQQSARDSFVGPVLPIDRSVSDAMYYRNSGDYNALFGSQKQSKEDYARFMEAMDRAEAYYSGKDRLNRAADLAVDTVRGGANLFAGMMGAKPSAGRELSIQQSRLERDSKLYDEMAQRAELIGSQGMYDRAAQGMAGRLAGYNKAASDYELENQARLERLKGTDLGDYYAQTMSRQDITAKIRTLEEEAGKARSEIEAAKQAQITERASNPDMRPSYMRGTESMSPGADNRLAEAQSRADSIGAELAQYQRALALRDDADARARYFTMAGGSFRFPRARPARGLHDAESRRSRSCACFLFGSGAVQRALAARSAASTRCSASTDGVTAPTPPGTGLTAAATAAASSVRTSPQSLPSTLLTPTSRITWPGRVCSAPIRPARPTAAISRSASRQTAARSGVRLWQSVTVASACSRSCATGRPITRLRPTTAARLPAGSKP